MVLLQGLSIFLNACLLVGLLGAFFGRAYDDGGMWAGLFHVALVALMFVAPAVSILTALACIEPRLRRRS